MRIGDLIPDYTGLKDLEVYALTHDSRGVTPGALFFVLAAATTTATVLSAPPRKRGLWRL